MNPSSESTAGFVKNALDELDDYIRRGLAAQAYTEKALKALQGDDPEVPYEMWDVWAALCGAQELLTRLVQVTYRRELGQVCAVINEWRGSEGA